MIYVTQTGIPRIIFTGDIEIQRPLTLQTWGNTLLIKEAGDESDTLEVRYHNIENGSTMLERITPQLTIFTMFLAHESTPEAPAPGLDLTYSRTIGVLHALWRQRYLDVDFKVEQDRLLATIERLTSETTYIPRPDFSDDYEDETTPSFIETPPSVTVDDDLSSP